MGIFSPRPQLCGMLQPMQQAAANTPSPTSASFAGLLATLAAPTSHSPVWNDDDLAGDVVTLSYEHALRDHARYKPSNPGGWPFVQAAPPRVGETVEQRGPVWDARMEVASATPAWKAGEPAPTTPSLSTGGGQSRKCASVTIRMSEAERAQLHQRAAEAGLTVSAYLRSCTFEAEALRDEVKETLARLRATTSAEKPSTPASTRRSRLGWFVRLPMPWGSNRRKS